ncbi:MULTISPECIES: hypothetical protein [unclassified Fusibacter]|uniref:hypothetical protein n=1 Tax=unclassified Fusibacter TaxID=2624464 RepID=UPI00101372C5|nr:MULTISPECIES: hypothetical protein [unclassified Fusibacter]MCK8060436.1 hypothetical protein [Fusibacter sp. A2]NPE20275.1 hypothetical protein [Fusibacter sp. A1]RXV63481.1 hypothetical protein DWB64_00485 [Fusibacter sp. A1]
MKRTLSILSVMIIIFGGVWLSDVLGIWSAESDKIPKSTLTGEFDPGDIRGSYTFLDIEQAFGIASAELAQAFDIVADQPQEFQVKSLETLYSYLNEGEDGTEIGTASVRYFVHLYTGIESDLVEETWLPKPALDLLLEKSKIGSDHVALSWGVELSEVPIVETEIVEEDHPEPFIKGPTTVQELVNKGMSIDTLEELLGVVIENRAVVIKDLCTENGLSFSEVKLRIEAYAVDHGLMD